MIWGKKKQPRNSSVKTLISRQTEVRGDVKFSDGMYIEVKVPFVKLNGVVIGDVHVSEHVELMSKARITGNVYYNLIEMAIGAEVNGKLVHSQEAEDVPLAIANSTDTLEVSD